MSIKLKSAYQKSANESKPFQAEIKLDLLGGRLLANSKTSCFVPKNYGNIGGMKSKIVLSAKYHKEGDFYIGSLLDFPEIFTHDSSIEGLKLGLLDSFSLYYDIDLDHVNASIALHEEPQLQKALS